MSIYVQKSLLKVTFSNILKNGTNSCWLPVKKKALITTIEKYWLSKANFLYLKIYDKETLKQTGFITRKFTSYTP